MEINSVHRTSYDDKDPEIQVRTDLWGQMSAPQLVTQRELLMDRLDSLHKMMSINASPSVLSMYNAMQMGLSDINQLIEHRSTNNKRRSNQ